MTSSGFPLFADFVQYRTEQNQLPTEIQNTGAMLAQTSRHDNARLPLQLTVVTFSSNLNELYQYFREII